MRICLKSILKIIKRNYPCIFKGHDIREIDGRRFKLAHQKGDVRQIINYFDGIVSVCMRPGCGWESYSGNPRPYFREIRDESNTGNSPG